MQRIHLIWLGLLLLGANAPITGQSVEEQVGTLRFSEIKSIYLLRPAQLGETFYAQIIFIIETEDQKPIRLREYTFLISKRKDCGPHREELGMILHSDLMNQNLYPEGYVELSRRKNEYTFFVNLGQDLQEVIPRIQNLFNLLGEYHAEPDCLDLVGKGTVGLQVKNGWIDREGYGIDFTFKPKVKTGITLE